MLQLVANIHKIFFSSKSFCLKFPQILKNLSCVSLKEFKFRKFCPHALKGQKPLAQGIALGNYGRKPVAL